MYMKLCAKSEGPDYNFKRERQRNLAEAVNVTYKKKKIYRSLLFQKGTVEKVKKKGLYNKKKSHLFVQLRVPCITNLTANNRRQQGNRHKERWSFLSFSTMHAFSEGIRVHRPSLETNIPLRSCPGTRHISLSARKTPRPTTVSSRYANKPA